MPGGAVSLFRVEQENPQGSGSTVFRIPILMMGGCTPEQPGADGPPRRGSLLGPRFPPLRGCGHPGLPLGRALPVVPLQVSVGDGPRSSGGGPARVMIVELGVPASLVGITCIALPLVFAPFRALHRASLRSHRCERRVEAASPSSGRGRSVQLRRRFWPSCPCVVSGWLLAGEGEAGAAPVWIRSRARRRGFGLPPGGGGGSTRSDRRAGPLAPRPLPPGIPPRVGGIMYGHASSPGG